MASDDNNKKGFASLPKPFALEPPKKNSPARSKKSDTEVLIRTPKPHETSDHDPSIPMWQKQKTNDQPRKKNKRSGYKKRNSTHERRDNGKRPRNTSASARKKRRRRHQVNPAMQRLALYSIACLTGIILLVIVLIRLMSNNAFAVYLDDRHLGYINYSEELTAEIFQADAIIHLENRRGYDVQVNETVHFRPARASASNRLTHQAMYNIMFDEEYGFTYQIAAVRIYVDGIPELLLRSQHEVEELKRRLSAPFINGQTREWEFVEDWQEVIALVDYEPDLFITINNAEIWLDRTVGTYGLHVVQSGENLGIIARAFGTTVTRITELNDSIDIHTTLHPGQVLRVETTKPLLTIRRFDEIQEVEIIDMPVEQRLNSALEPATTRIVQQGQNGSQFAHTRIEFINHDEIGRETLEAEIIDDPVMHIVEYGPDS